MQQVLATYRSVETNVTHVQLASSRQDIAIQLNNSSKIDDLNLQQQQLVDEVVISQEAVDKLQQAQKLLKHLQNYLDYLYGREKKVDVKIGLPEDNPEVTIEGRSTNLAASVTVVTYSEESLEILADFDDGGNVTGLSIAKTSIDAEYIHASYILEDTQFYAKVNG